MYTIDEILTALLHLAKQNHTIATRILASADKKNPVDALCRISTELGYPMYAMDLITAGEEEYAARRRSTNGGGENSPGLDYADDYYELFMAQIRTLE